MQIMKIAAMAVMSLASAMAQALEIQPYSAAAAAELQQSGKPYALHFHADWCPVCRTQKKAMQDLKDAGELNMTVLVADYDKERALKKERNVRTQSTLIVYRGANETSRLAGETDAQKIKNALKSAF